MVEKIITCIFVVFSAQVLGAGGMWYINVLGCVCSFWGHILLKQAQEEVEGLIMSCFT